MSPAVISVSRLTKQYGQGDAAIDALRDVSFDVPERQFVSVTGPSGCGKTTLLHLIAGFTEPTSGHIVVGGRDLATLTSDERSDLRLRTIGFVFQDSNLLPTFTALENVAVALEFLGVGWKEAKARSARALEAVRVSSRAFDRLPSDVSGGERQRVAIARALVTEPRLLLADEPTGNLDSSTGRAILDLLAEMNDSRGLTVVMVTHSTFGGTYGHRTIELCDGRIVHDVVASQRTDLRLVQDDEA